MKFTNFGKKLFAFVAIALFGLALVACNKPDNGGNGGGNENNEQEQLKAQHQANVNAVLDGIFFDDTQISELKGNLALVQSNAKYPEVKIEWTSSEADLIASDGTVTRPALDDPRAVDGKVEVTLTVSASQGEAKGTKTFTVYVLGEKKVSVNTIQAAKASFYTLMQEAGMKYSDKTSEMAVSVEFTGNVVAKISKGIFVNDGSGVVYVYGSSDAVVGDTVRVSGNLYAYYGLIEIGSNVSVEKVAAQEIAAPVFEETTVSEYTAALDAALDANGKIVDVEAFLPFSCGALKLYAKVEKGDKGSGDTYYLADPYTAQSVAIYHYATDDHAATLDALVGKYVYANVYAYDTHSALADRYRVIWDGSEMVEAEAPDTLTPAQQIESILSGLSVAKKTIENIDLGAVENVVWSLKAASDNAVLEGNTLKVTRPAFGSENAKVTVVATATVENVSDSKEFEVEVVAEFNPTIKEISEFTAEGVYKFGFYQGNNLEYNYITGEMSGYYPATTTNPAKAADVKVKTVEGGYQILVGSKYLEIVQSGTYTNVVFSESASIAWAYDADLNTFTYELAGNTYYLGTYKTYNTLSASTVDKAATSFVGHLYTVEYEEEEKPEPIEPAEGTHYTAKYTGTETTNMVEGDNAATLGLDDTLFNVTATKRDTLYPGLGKDGTIRLYNTIDPNPANTITFEITTGVIKQIVITFSQNPDNCEILVDGVAVTGVDGVYNINAASFTINNIGTSQLRISSIEIIA